MRWSQVQCIFWILTIWSESHCQNWIKKISILIYFETNLCYRMSQQLHIQRLQILQSEQQKSISSSFLFLCFLTRWDFELKYHNRTLLINASSEIDEIGIIEYSHDHSRFYIHGYTCINSEYFPNKGFSLPVVLV